MFLDSLFKTEKITRVTRCKEWFYMRKTPSLWVQHETRDPTLLFMRNICTHEGFVTFRARNTNRCPVSLVSR